MRQILHISDIHFGPHHVPEVAAGVLDLIARRRPALVVLSGDLTQRAKPQQFREARAFVDRIAAEAETLVVPGNHDVPLWRVWERLFSRYGVYRRHFSEELEPVFRDEELLVVGINSAFNWTTANGRITLSRLRQVGELLAQAPPGVAKIITVHHELIPAPSFGTQRVLRNAHEAVDLFSRSGVELVLAGHLHQAYIGRSETFYPSGRRPFPILHSGTTTSDRGRGGERRRFTCNWIRLDDDELAISHLGWDPGAGRFVEWSRHLFPRRQ
ncbi:MAG: 3',5'-cyclic-nucleotide phosphodiesterase, partial [bacterium]|nr:3',5'-cyclic-nucleotide phosphodiesterase [bacterium]